MNFNVWQSYLLRHNFPPLHVCCAPSEDRKNEKEKKKTRESISGSDVARILI